MACSVRVWRRVVDLSIPPLFSSSSNSRRAVKPSSSLFPPFFFPTAHDSRVELPDAALPPKVFFLFPPSTAFDKVFFFLLLICSRPFRPSLELPSPICSQERVLRVRGPQKWPLHPRASTSSVMTLNRSGIWASLSYEFLSFSFCRDGLFRQVLTAASLSPPFNQAAFFVWRERR